MDTRRITRVGSNESWQPTPGFRRSVFRSSAARRGCTGRSRGMAGLIKPSSPLICCVTCLPSSRCQRTPNLGLSLRQGAVTIPHGETWDGQPVVEGLINGVRGKALVDTRCHDPVLTLLAIRRSGIPLKRRLCRGRRNTILNAGLVLITATTFYCARASQPGSIGGSVWTAQGAAPAWKGDAIVENREVAGAVQAVVAHPTDANSLWVGAVNGGIWRTTNALATNVHWTPLTDFMPSLGVSSLDLDPTDPTYRTLVAGLGGTSSLGLEGPNVHGLLRSIDGGDSWSYLDGQGLFPDKDISGVLERGRMILVAVDDDSWPTSRLSTFGIYRSVDSGTSFTHLSTPTGQPYGLPYGRSVSLGIFGEFSGWVGRVREAVLE